MIVVKRAPDEWCADLKSMRFEIPRITDFKIGVQHGLLTISYISP